MLNDNSDMYEIITEFIELLEVSKNTMIPKVIINAPFNN